MSTSAARTFLIAALMCYSGVFQPKAVLTADEVPTQYNGDQVLEITADGMNIWRKVEAAILETNPETIELWRPPRAVRQGSLSVVGQVYVPRPFVPAFRSKLVGIPGVVYRTLIANLQRLIDEEKRSNAAASCLTWPAASGDSRSKKQRLANITVSDSIVGRYPTPEELTGWLNDTASRFADIASLISIGETFQGRKLYVLKISESSSSGRPAMWIDAGIHAREWISVSTAVYFIYTILNAFGAEDNPAERSLVRSVDWYIAPTINPDGYAYTHQINGTRHWRKNRAIYPNSSYSGLFNKTCTGVDNNRNFDFKWATAYPVLEPCYEEYCGPSASSELENKAVSSFIMQHRQQIKAVLTLHSYGQLIMTRWAYTDQLKTPRHNHTMELMKRAVDATFATGGEKYSYGSTSDVLYFFSGGLGDWARGVAGINYSFELELRDTGTYGFVLPANYVLPVGREAWSAVRVIATQIVDENKMAAAANLVTSSEVDLAYNYTMLADNMTSLDGNLTSCSSEARFYESVSLYRSRRTVIVAIFSSFYFYLMTSEF